MNKKKKNKKDTNIKKTSNYKTKMKNYKKITSNNSSTSNIGFKKGNIFEKSNQSQNNYESPFNQKPTNPKIHNQNKFESSLILKPPVKKVTENINKKNNVKLNSAELNLLPYDEALKIDARTYIQYYISLIKYKQKIIFTFFNTEDYNTKDNKISLFFFSFSLYYITNELLFNDSIMHRIYEDGKLHLVYQIPMIVYSTIISSVINIIINYLSLTERSIIELKNSKQDKETQKLMINSIRNKVFIYYLLAFFVLLIFWYYISCFCMVYRNTQILLAINTIISFSIDLLYPFGLCILPGLFRLPALKFKSKNKQCLYKISHLLQII